MSFEHRITGYDFVRALLLHGYRVAGGELGHAVIRKGETQLAVPQRQLDDGEIVSLLDLAGILPLQFLLLLDRIAGRETLPDAAEIAADRAQGG